MTLLRPNRARTLVLAALLAATAYVVPAAAADTPATAARPSMHAGSAVAHQPTLRVLGAVQDRERLTASDLHGLPQQSVTATYSAAGVPTTRTFTGPLLLDVVDQAGPRLDPAVKNDALAFAVVAHATDGYRATVAWGEIDPGFEAKQVLVALTEDGVTLDRSRLVVPGDAKGGRYVSNLNYLRVVDLG